MKKFLFLILVLFCVVIKIISQSQNVQSEGIFETNDSDSEKAFETYLEGTITSYQTNAKIIGDWAFLIEENYQF